MGKSKKSNKSLMVTSLLIFAKLEDGSTAQVITTKVDQQIIINVLRQINGNTITVVEDNNISWEEKFSLLDK